LCNEIVLSSEGEVRALVVGIGGFLGMGEQDVAVTMDQITVASNSDDRSDMFGVVNTGSEMLKSSPVYQRMSMTTEQTGANMAQGSDRSPFAAPPMARDGYNRVEAADVTTELLMGKSVCDVKDADMGTVTNMIIADNGMIAEVAVDFGGFLGIGVSHAALIYRTASQGRARLRCRALFLQSAQCLCRDFDRTDPRRVIVDHPRYHQFVRLILRNEMGKSGFHRSERPSGGTGQRLFYLCQHRRWNFQIGVVNRPGQFARVAHSQPRKSEKLRRAQITGLLIRIRSANSRRNHDMRLRQLGRRAKPAAIDRKRLFQHGRGEMRCECVRQSQIGRQLRAIKA
jgi:hypothetical protein